MRIKLRIFYRGSIRIKKISRYDIETLDSGHFEFFFFFINNVIIIVIVNVNGIPASKRIKKRSGKWITFDLHFCIDSKFTKLQNECYYGDFNAKKKKTINFPRLQIISLISV